MDADCDDKSRPSHTPSEVEREAEVVAKIKMILTAAANINESSDCKSDPDLASAVDRHPGQKVDKQRDRHKIFSDDSVLLHGMSGLKRRADECTDRMSNAN